MMQHGIIDRVSTWFAELLVGAIWTVDQALADFGGED